MKLSDKQWAFLQDVAQLIAYAAMKEYKLTGGELLRTEYQQTRYVELGLSKTNDSMHLSRMAIDLNLFVNGKILTDKNHEAFQDLGNYWLSLSSDNRWGGNYTSFSDPFHFQRNA